MNSIRAITVALLGMAAYLPGTSLAQIVNCAFNNHNYEVINFSCAHDADVAACWNRARMVAGNLQVDGAFGDLATITSEAEQQCVEDAWDAWREEEPNQKPEALLGASQPAGELDRFANWTWVDGTPLLGMDPVFPGATKQFWRNNEPNDNYGPGSEQHAGFGLGNQPTVNDEGAKNNFGGALIEYPNTVEVPVTECFESEEGCPLGPNVDAQLPDDIVCDDPECDDAVLTAQTWNVLDERVAAGQCGTHVLNITVNGDGSLTTDAATSRDPNADSTLGRHLCGHPGFILTKTEGIGFELGPTASVIESDPPAGNNYECGPPPMADGLDNTIWDTSGYQTNDTADMVETFAPTTGVDQLFVDNTVLESLFECGSSRGKGFRDSFHFAGLCIAFGIEGCPDGPGADDSMPTQLNPANFDYMNEFLIYKLERTLDVLKEAKRNGAFVRKRDFKALRLYVKLARLYSRWGWYRAALVKIRFAQHRLERTEFNPVPNENYSAELDTRLSNAELTSAGRIVQYLE